jgi:dipeptidyl aminopeptidase/acylaminoacyl peptidase
MQREASEAEFPLEELASLPEFHHPVADPAGERVAFYYDGTGRNELYVMDVETGQRRQVSDGEVPRDAKFPIAWSADGDRIYFHRDDGGDEQNDVHAISLTGDHEVLVAEPGQNVLADVSPDGRYLLYAGTRSGQMNLHRYDTETGADELLTEYEQPVRGAGFSPDGDRIAYTTNETANLENQDVYVASVEALSNDEADPRKLDVGDDGVETTFSDWSPDGSAVLVDDESEDLNRCGVYELDAESVTWFGPGEYEERPVGYTPDGDAILAMRFRDGGIVPVHYDVDSGEGHELALDSGVAAPVSGAHDGGFLADGDALFSYTRPDARQELYRYDLDGDDAAPLIEAEYGDIDPDAFVDAEYVTYESTGTDEVFGTEGEAYDIGGILYESDGEDSPGIVHVHGGPHGRSMKNFDTYAQFLVDRGYTVFQPNYRGSIGRGREFKNAIHGDWGGLEQEDVAEAGKWLADREGVDADRIAVYGGSYGGYTAYMQHVKHPDLWASAMAWVGITDLVSMFGNSMPHFQTVLRQQMGDPEENEDLWRERSPVTHVDDAEGPILMVHGVNDPRCPVAQARTYRDALEERGWEVEEDFVYEELSEEGHGSTDVEQKIRALRIVADYVGEWV